MVRRRSLTSMSGVAMTGSCTMISLTFTSPSAPLRLASAASNSWKVSMPAMRPWSSTTSEPRFCSAMVLTASTARSPGSALINRLPLTLRISLTCMADPPGERKALHEPYILEPDGFGDKYFQLAMQLLANRSVGLAPDQVLEFVRVLVEIVELVQLAVFASVHPVDQLVALGADRLVGHADQPRIGLLGPVFREDCFSPRLLLSFE